MRIDPAVQAGEFTMLSEYLDHHRATLRMKAEGLDQGQMARQLPASDLTLAGLLKHAALNEDHWFQVVLLGLPRSEPWASAPFADDEDWEFHSAVDDSPAELFALYEATCERSRDAVRSVGDLDALSVGESRRDQKPFTMRWIMLHMLEETARHNGHADLLRESIDGATGE